jgi:hypothetical protein
MTDGGSADASASDPSHDSRRILAVVGTCLAILFVAYVVLSGTMTGKVADATGARHTSSFNAMWFADPALASRPIPAGTTVEVVVANQTGGTQTLHWSTTSDGSTLEQGTIRVERASTKSFVVHTDHALPGRFFVVGLNGTSIAIKAMIAS